MIVKNEIIEARNVAVIVNSLWSSVKFQEIKKEKCENHSKLLFFIVFQISF